MRLPRPSSPVGIAILANVAVIALALIALAVQSCTRASAQSASDCLAFGPAPGVLTQSWVVGNPPAGLAPGSSYVVSLSDGEAEIAGVSLGGSEILLTIPVPSAQLPAGGIGVNLVQINGQWQQLGCPAIGN